MLGLLLIEMEGTNFVFNLIVGGSILIFFIKILDIKVLLGALLRAVL